MHVVPTRERKGSVYFILGRVVHPREEPMSYEVKVIRPEQHKVIIGRKGVYILDDTLCKKLISEVWEEYVRTIYGKRERRTKQERVEHPVEISEERLRGFIRKEGIHISTASCAFFSYVEPTPAEEMKRLIEDIREFFRKERSSGVEMLEGGSYY
ncbi:hypothetical protein [Pampinifervens florentissimum]|uniref:hypothetical protein n=1 Tax=Pampinifervens florentissimum TaxID=1632019 RepID=UPI0013B4886C|nr:hypothetical protein [Hydrogenobacter sp. T-8]QID33062.1 hypothetical protein G3M65_04480 [Hydrogenobacter sp. T-8]